MIKRAEHLSLCGKVAHSDGFPLALCFYRIDNCREEIDIYKKMYKDGKLKKIYPYYLFHLLERAFDAAKYGYLLYRSDDLKIEAENFAKAIEKFGKILGENILSHGDPECLKEIRDLEKFKFTKTSFRVSPDAKLQEP